MGWLYEDGSEGSFPCLRTDRNANFINDVISSRLYFADWKRNTTNVYISSVKCVMLQFTIRFLQSIIREVSFTATFLRKVGQMGRATSRGNEVK